MALASKSTIAALTRPGGIVPIDAETTGRLVLEVLRLRAALSEMADGDAYFDGPVKFMQIARVALNSSR